MAAARVLAAQCFRRDDRIAVHLDPGQRLRKQVDRNGIGNERDRALGVSCGARCFISRLERQRIDEKRILELRPLTIEVFEDDQIIDQGVGCQPIATAPLARPAAQPAREPLYRPSVDFRKTGDPFRRHPQKQDPQKDRPNLQRLRRGAFAAGWRIGCHRPQEALGGLDQRRVLGRRDQRVFRQWDNPVDAALVLAPAGRLDVQPPQIVAEPALR